LSDKVNKTSNQALSTAANAMTISGHTITLNRGDGTTDTVTVPDNNTTYSVGDSGLTQKNFTTTLKSKLDGIASGATNVTTENIQDIVGAMVSGNSESNITVTYQDADGTLDFSVAADVNTWRGIDDTPVNGQTSESISSNWAYDHQNDTTAIHGSTSSNTANRIVQRDASGNFSAGTITATCTNAQYADLAEKYSADADIAPGTVVSFGGESEVTTSSVDGDRKIAGVISTNPAYLMNHEAEGVEVALTGRVPCRVTGKIEKGDMLVSAGNGMARAEEDPKLGSVIGKALESNESGDAVIEVVVGKL
jgi:hypothetical protein